jgi:hypothetical protein
MSKILENATSHFREKISGEMQCIEVPEWKSKIYFKRAITLKDQSKLIELASQGKTVEALVESLIIKARNEDGSKMFSMVDKITFMNEIDPQIIIRVVGEINAVSDSLSNADEVEKN